MELADLIVLLKDGKIAQSGAPRELYDRPADEFVMGFLGPVSKVRGELVRPHDVALSDRPEDGWEEAMVQRVVHLGFEVRVELVRHDGEEVSVQLTRAGTAIQISCRCSAAPRYSTSSGASPRTLASGPSTARMMSAREISSAGWASQ